MGQVHYLSSYYNFTALGSNDSIGASMCFPPPCDERFRSTDIHLDTERDLADFFGRGL
jgi:hypothetical protein